MRESPGRRFTVACGYNHQNSSFSPGRIVNTRVLLTCFLSVLPLAGCDRKPPLPSSAPTYAQGCEIDGKPIRAVNDLEIAGRTGTIRCRDAGGKLVSEGLVRDGKWVGTRKVYYPAVGKLRKESQVDEKGQAEGLEREYYSNGNLMSERTIRDSRVIGREKTFSYSGKASSLAFYEEGLRIAAIAYDELGRLDALQCTRGRDVLPEVHDMCGFGQVPVETVVDVRWDKGHMTYLNGVLVDYALYDRRGRLKSQVTLKGNQKITRSFHKNGQVELDGAVTVDADGRDAQPLNNVIKKYDPSGQLIQEARWQDGVLVVSDNWYPNGNKKQEIRSKRINKGSRTDVVTITKKFSEDGKLLSEEPSTLSR